MHKYNRDEINKEFNINISDLELPEQIQFVNYIKRIEAEEIENTKSFIKKYGVPALKTFLSLESGGKEMGDKILTLGEKLPKKSAQLLFSKYGEIVSAVDSVEDLLQQALQNNAQPEIIEQARQSLLLRGKNLLEEYADNAATCSGKECKALGDELNEKLSLAKASVFAFSVACRSLVEKGQFNFEDFKAAQLVYEKSPLPEDIREQIIAMHKENTKQYPEKLRDYWRGTLKDGLENENPKQLVVYVTYDETVTTVMRVIEQDDGSWYGASFNVNPTVQGSRVGTELLRRVIGNLAEKKPFVADCFADNPMLKVYLEKFGFEITETFENYHDTGTKVYQITKFPEKK